MHFMERNHNIVYHKEYPQNRFLKHTHACINIQGVLLQWCFHFKQGLPRGPAGMLGSLAVPSLPCHSPCCPQWLSPAMAAPGWQCCSQPRTWILMNTGATFRPQNAGNAGNAGKHSRFCSAARPLRGTSTSTHPYSTINPCRRKGFVLFCKLTVAAESHLTVSGELRGQSRNGSANV